MTGTFDNVALIVTDLVNAVMSVISTVVTGDNASILITAAIIIAVIYLIFRYSGLSHLLPKK
jgi:hypothetical protein